MISRLRGILLEQAPPHIIVEVGGLAYELELSMLDFPQCPDTGQEVVLYTHLVVREDAHMLYGFLARTTRALFRRLIKVNGVGPKVALCILSGIPPAAFVDCIVQKDVQRLVRLPGVGKKMAERLVIELQDKLSGIDGKGLACGTDVPVQDPAKSVMEEAIAALLALGYKSQEAQSAVKIAAKTQHTCEDIIRHALGQLSRGVL